MQFQMFGIPVRVESGFLFMMGIITVFGLQAHEAVWQILASIAVIFVSILFHELGHAFAYRSFGLPVAGIWIHGFGGYVRAVRAGSYKQSVLISVAGPVAGLLLGTASLVLLQFANNPYSYYVLQWSFFINFFWSVFNLLPLFPMDGGNALMSALAIFMEPRKAAVITHGVGVVVGIGVAILSYTSGLAFAAMFSGYFAYQNGQLFQRARVLHR